MQFQKGSYLRLPGPVFAILVAVRPQSPESDHGRPPTWMSKIVTLAVLGPVWTQRVTIKFNRYLTGYVVTGRETGMRVLGERWGERWWERW